MRPSVHLDTGTEARQAISDSKRLTPKADLPKEHNARLSANPSDTFGTGYPIWYRGYTGML
jgi:hypothetical protein